MLVRLQHGNLPMQHGLVNRWWEEAACRGKSQRIFFQAATEAQALEICGLCEVRLECREDAMSDLEFNQGVRGGTTYEQRLRMAGGKPTISVQRKRRRWAPPS